MQQIFLNKEDAAREYLEDYERVKIGVELESKQYIFEFNNSREMELVLHAGNSETGGLLNYATKNELAELEQMRKTLTLQIYKKSASEEIKNVLDTILARVMSRYSEKTSVYEYGKLVNGKNPQDYLDMGISYKADEQKWNVQTKTVHENQVVSEKQYEIVVGEDSVASFKEQYRTIREKVAQELKLLHTDLKYPFILYSSFGEHKEYEHRRNLIAAGYSVLPKGEAEDTRERSMADGNYQNHRSNTSAKKRRKI